MPGSWLHSDQGRQCLGLYSGPSQNIALNSNILEHNALVGQKSANSAKKNPGSSDTIRSNVQLNQQIVKDLNIFQKVYSEKRSKDASLLPPPMIVSFSS